MYLLARPRFSSGNEETPYSDLEWGSDFRYTVQAPGGVDVNTSLGRHIFECEAEIAFPCGIGRRFAEVGYRVHGNSRGEWFPNPYFDASP